MFYKKEIKEFLDARGIEYEYYDHPAVFTMEEDEKLDIPHQDSSAKNIFVRDDKKREYILISIKGSDRIDLKAFAKEHGLRPLTLASKEDLMGKLGLTPGSVSPFGLLNNGDCSVKYYIDSRFEGDGIVVHPNDNTASIYIKTEELLKLIREHGNSVFEFTVS